MNRYVIRVMFSASQKESKFEYTYKCARNVDTQGIDISVHKTVLRKGDDEHQALQLRRSGTA